MKTGRKPFIPSEHKVHTIEVEGRFIGGAIFEWVRYPRPCLDVEVECIGIFTRRYKITGTDDRLRRFINDLYEHEPYMRGAIEKVWREQRDA